jgi:general secretion pathway protein D
VGQEIPITTGEALGLNLTNSFRTVTRQDVGIQLAVRPQISAGGTIKLDIKQIVSSIAGPVATGSSDLILNKREIETSVTVGDGQILALGGLLDEQERRSLQRVPLLGDIPIVGELFRSRTRSKQKTNLMVFIRPTIVRGRDAGDALTANRWDNLRDEQEARGDGISSLDALAREYLRTEPPVRRPPEINPSLRKAPQP